MTWAFFLDRKHHVTLGEGGLFRPRVGALVHFT